MHETLPDFPLNPIWFWAPIEHPNQIVLLRWNVTGLNDVEDLRIQVTANTRYFVWSSGQYISQGACPSPWPENAVDSHSISLDTIVDGSLNLSFLAHWYGVRTQSHPLARPGLWFQLQVKRSGSWENIEPTINECKICLQAGWQQSVFRRTWATAWMELFDSSKHPHDWMQNDFDDSDWQHPVVVERDEIVLVPRQTPYLKEWLQPAGSILTAARVQANAPMAEDGAGLTKMMDEEPWDMVSTEELQCIRSQWEEKGTIELNGNGSGLALCFDLGRQYSGQPEFEIETDDGIVDYYGAELLEKGRPWGFRKNGEYGNRWLGSTNAGHFRTINYNGFRYLLIVLRPGKSPIKLKHLAVWCRQADIKPVQSFQSDDSELQRIWDISIHTLHIATQDTPVDCPTREQGLFIGDGVWNALWLAKLFDEPSYFTQLLDTVAKTQYANGLFPSAIFSSLEPPHFLLDFCLIFVWSVDVYREQIGDLETVKRMMPVAERTLAWYQDKIAQDGLIHAEPKITNMQPGGDFQVVFIDHPGVGWHWFPHPGIERSTRQLGLNAYLAIAIDAFLTSATAVDYKTQLKPEFLDTDTLRKNAKEAFWNPELGRFADCVDENGEQKGWSEQSQALGIVAGIVSPDEAKGALTKTFAERDNGEVCRCSPYSWIYLAQAMEIAGLRDQILPLVRADWSKMAKHEWTTTWWETFEGTNDDSLCHPWSALPAWLLSDEVKLA
ncbi:hypothetical protein [Rubellicoccus peritrichatus]|uniref:Alpha-L-rhamnosidase six-hairpin glycosidase domain-containing protein n=1 Tax=Rubellicoccus peritrichatus TaxID=3080537 RepID=A0AAQ3QWK7_9BACT|nr:hypothetical protein [Puniceicoccus sp. CR14]WOO41987.1 hypothetical protein RZN69_02725 [Puniceicoccus sp. CR14]